MHLLLRQLYERLRWHGAAVGVGGWGALGLLHSVAAFRLA